MQIDEKNMTLLELKEYYEKRMALRKKEDEEDAERLKHIYALIGYACVAERAQSASSDSLYPCKKECLDIIDSQISQIQRSKAIRLILQKAYPDFLIPLDVINIMEKNGVAFEGNQKNSVRVDLLAMAKKGKIESKIILEGKKDRMYRLKPNEENS